MKRAAKPAPHPRAWPFQTYKGEPYKPPPVPRAPPKAPPQGEDALM